MASHVATDGGTPELKGQDGHMASSVEKGLKMKIKRKSVHSGQRHEIVSEDDAVPPAAKAKKTAAQATNTKDEKQSQNQLQQQQQSRLNGSNGQSTMQLNLQQQQNQIQSKATNNGPPISASESVMRARSNESVSQRDQGTLCSSVGIVTEPDSLGVCEPGTSVLLEGIVWQETEGVLVVNVTWRGKTYVGTLLDATRHDWAPPRLTEDNDERNRTLGFGGRAKRTGQTRTLSGSEDNNLSKLRNGKGRRSFTPVPASPAADEKNNGNGSGAENKEATAAVGGGGGKGFFATAAANAGAVAATNNSSGGGGKVTRVMAEEEDAIEEASMLDCPEPDCHKRFKQLNGLRYHQTAAHNDRTPPPPKESSDRDGDDSQVAVSASQPISSIQPVVDENETSKDSVCSNATTEKSDTKSRDAENSEKGPRKDFGKPSTATCDSNTSNSVHAADTYNCNSNGASMSADESDAQNMATNADLENDLGGAPSPAYSDISDDNNPNTTSEANGSPAVASAPSQKSHNGEHRHRSDTRDVQNCQSNSRPSSTGSVAGVKASTPKPSSNPVIGMPPDDHRKDLLNLNKMSPAVVTSAASAMSSMNVPLLGAPMNMSPLVSQGVSQMAKSGLSQPSLFPSFPPSLKLGQSIPPLQIGVPPQLMAMSHRQSPSPRGKNTPPAQERLTPKNSQQATPNQFMPQLGSDSFSFSQTAHKRMSPSVDSRREAGGPSPKPLSQGLPGPFGGPPPNMFLGGNPFGAPFQSPFGLEAMYHHPGYMERFGPAPGVPGGAAAQGKAALDLLQQVSRR